MGSANLSKDDYLQIKGQYDAIATRSHSIDTRCYVDPRFLDAEREHIFQRSWQFL